MLKADDHLSNLTQKWFAALENEKGYSAHTLIAYQHDLQVFINFVAGHKGAAVTLTEVLTLELSDFRAWLSFLAEKKIGPASRARALSMLHSFYKWLERHRLGENAAIHRLKRPKQDQKLPRPLNQQVLTQTFEGLPEQSDLDWVGARNRALFVLLYGCGLRISEALQLRLQEFRQAGDVLRIFGKGKKERVVPLLPGVRAEIEAYLKLCPFALQPGEEIFRGEKGKKLQANVVTKALRDFRKMMNFPDHMTPHAFRHSYASHLLKNGADLRSIQELLGHASLSSTQRYTEIDEAHLLEVYQKAHPRAIVD